MTDVSHHPEVRRYVATVDGEQVGFAQYQLTDELVVFTHTEVDQAYEGRGIGSAIAKFALDDVRAQGVRKVLPICPFIRDWMAKNREYVDLAYGAPASTAKD